MFHHIELAGARKERNGRDICKMKQKFILTLSKNFEGEGSKKNFIKVSKIIRKSGFDVKLFSSPPEK